MVKSESSFELKRRNLQSFNIGKGVHQGCILSLCLFNLYAEYIMLNVRLDEAQAGIKIGGRYINNLKYADNTTLMAESEEELKSLLMKVKEASGKAGLKSSIQKTKIMASGPISSVQFSSVAQSCLTLRLQESQHSGQPSPNWTHWSDRPTHQVRKQQLELDMKQQTGSK